MQSIRVIFNAIDAVVIEQILLDIKVKTKQEDLSVNQSSHLWFDKTASSTVFLQKLPVTYHCRWRSTRGGNFNEK